MQGDLLAGRALLSFAPGRTASAEITQLRPALAPGHSAICEGGASATAGLGEGGALLSALPTLGSPMFGWQRSSPCRIPPGPCSSLRAGQSRDDPHNCVGRGGGARGGRALSKVTLDKAGERRNRPEMTSLPPSCTLLFQLCDSASRTHPNYWKTAPSVRAGLGVSLTHPFSGVHRVGALLSPDTVPGTQTETNPSPARAGHLVMVRA